LESFHWRTRPEFYENEIVTGKPIHFEKRDHDLGRLFMCLGQAIICPVAAAGGVGLLCKFAGLEDHPASFWLVVAPLIYLLWLFLLLVFYVIETSLLGLFYQKPRRYDEMQDRSLVPFAITLMLYGHGFILYSLPLVSMLLRAPFFSWLILRAYSTKVFLGRGAWLAGEIWDPDLTVIGPDVVIGEDCRIVAHSVTRSPEGSVLFQSAPVELGAACTIGGGTQIELGVKVGAGSLVEPRSHVQPFTRIPPGEVWGGSPAVFRRKREFTPADSSSEASTSFARTPAAATDAKKLHRLIADALGISAEKITAETSAENCPQWDSIGKMTIAAALHDRFGLNLPPEIVFKLDSITDVEKAVAGAAGREIQAGAISLPANPELLPLLDPVPTLAALARETSGLSGAAQKIRVVIAATFIAQPLASALQLYSRAFGLNADVVFFDFNQVPQALLLPESPMRKNREGLNVVLIRPDDLPGKDSDERKAVAGQFLDAIKNFTATSGCALLVSDLPPVISQERRELQTEAAELQIWWRRQLASIPGVEILNFAEIIEELGKTAARDAQMEREASAPFSPPVYQRLGIGIARALRKSRVPPKKVLALDCDNTLWGGVAGEDGLDGIQLGKDAAGRGFTALQSKILALKQRGVLLALVSKNLADDVWDAIENHPRMILRRKDFAAARINWQPKSENLRALAEELKLGVDSIVLLDDNPVERLEVEANCPQVTVVPLPPQTDRYAEILSRLWCFDGAGETLEDEKRNDYALQEIQRKQFRQSAGLESYLNSLELKTVMRVAAEQELSRVSQLLQKTNQFNLSLKRRTLPETRALLPTHDIWVVSASDRFGDYGLVGVCIARREDESLFLDSFLMSCRVLGRGVEEAFLHGIAQKARFAGTKYLRGEFVAGARNQPMKNFLQKSGFTCGKDGIYELDLHHVPAAPAHLNLKID
jgi:FkbH-like protein